LAVEISRLSTEVADLNATQISTEIQLFAQQELPWPKVINWYPFSGPGSVWQTAQAPELSLTTYTESDTLGMTVTDADAFDMSNRQITVSMKGIDVGITLFALQCVTGDLQGAVRDSIRKAWIDKLDTDLMALYTEAPSVGPDHEIGAQNTPLDYDTFLQGFELLAAQAVPNPITWMIGPTQISEVLNITQFSKFLEYGREVLTQEIQVPTGFLGVAPLGVGIYWSNNAVSSTGIHSMMFSKGAFGYVEKAPFTVDVNSSNLMSKERTLYVAGTCTYGVGGIRDTSTTNKFVVDIVS
jgi:hypothetical protein